MAPSPIDLSVLLVTYNSRRFIDDCLQAVERTVRHHSVEVVAVDNASSDGTAAHLRAHWPSVRTIDMGRNAGFAAANNRALAATSGRHVLLLNGDAVVAPGALDALIEFLDANPAAGVVAPKVCNPDGSDQGTARAFPTPAAAVWGRRSPLTKAFPRSRWARRYLVGREHRTDEPFAVDWVSGACLMVRRSVIDEVGGLDDGFFMHWEDADWCRRIQDAGHEVWCLPGVQAWHEEGGSRRGWPAAQVRHFHRGAYRYYRKHHLHGPRGVFRPVAAAALAARAALVITRNELRRASAGHEPAPQVPIPVGEPR
jgi:GT2 family glycosyltransferase